MVRPGCVGSPRRLDLFPRAVQLLPGAQWHVTITAAAAALLSVAWLSADTALRQWDWAKDHALGVVVTLTVLALIASAAVRTPGPYYEVWIAVFGMPVT